MANNPTEVPLLSLPDNLLFEIGKSLCGSDIDALVATCRSLRAKRSELDFSKCYTPFNSQIPSIHSLSLTTPAAAIPIAPPSQPHVHFAADLTEQNSLVSSSAFSITGQPPLSHMDGNPSSMSSSPTSGNEFDSHASSDTELTTPEEDDEWVFELTPAILRRLRKLPNQDGAALTELPTELQCEIFSYLDKIDATSLGLTCPRTYAIYRSIHGVGIPLNTRRQGPNHLERAWEVVGKQECAQCGIYRCELYQHIKTWMPADMEYCSFKLKFGSKGENGVAENCFRGKPSKPRRCGRHPLRTTSVHQDDSLAMQATR